MPEKKKILIAEDERPMARALELKLNKYGFEAKVVSNGEEALEELGKTKYDLLLLDLMMPKKDGFGVLEGIKEKGYTIPVIVSTNLSQENDVKKAKELGAKDYFVKSDTPINEVIKRVEKVLANNK
ncbi:response regulator [Patescibacteria group bacterium]|nr:response regulator [Patescibacteria group bacterium]